MEPGQTSQVAIAGLIFALLSFVGAVFAGVYVLYYNKSAADEKLKMAMTAQNMMYRALHQPPPQRQQQQPQTSITASFSQMPPQPMAPMDAAQTVAGAYPAPRIPSTVRSGPVGTFFDDELTQP